MHRPGRRPDRVAATARHASARHAAPAPAIGRRAARGRGTSAPRRRTASSGRSSAPRRCRAARAGGRRCTRSAGHARARPRAPRGGSSRPRCPTCSSTTAGRPVAAPMPSAQNAADRSSRRTCTRIAVVARERERERRRARAGRDDRVGDSPRRAHSSTSAGAKARGRVALGHRSATMPPWCRSCSCPGFTQTACVLDVRCSSGMSTARAGDRRRRARHARDLRPRPRTAIGDAGGRGHLRRLLDGRPAVPAARARPARRRARSRAGERVARAPPDAASARARVASRRGAGAGHRARRRRRVPRALARAAAVRVAPARRAGRRRPSQAAVPRTSPPACASSGRARWNRSGTASPSSTMPVLLVTGTDDAKFDRDRARRCAQRSDRTPSTSRVHGGHALPLEQPADGRGLVASRQRAERHG